MHRRDMLKTVGAALTVPVVGHHATAQGAPYQPLGRVGISGAKEAVVDPVGETVFVATTTGFATVDVSTPTDPTILAERRNLLENHDAGPLRAIWDVKLDQDRLVVAGPASPVSDVVAGFLLYDVSNPTQPERVAFYKTDFPIHNCFIRDDLVYLTGNDRQGNPLVIVDVTDDTPTEVGRWSLFDRTEEWQDVHWQLRWLHDVWVHDDIAYLAYWDAGTWLVDVSDPAEPAYITTIGGQSLDDLAAVPDEDANAAVTELPGNDHYVTVNEDASLLGIGKEAWDEEATERAGGPAGIELWDISTLSAPRKRATIAPPQPSPADPSMAAYSLGTVTGANHVGCHECANRQADKWLTAHNFQLVGERLFSSWYDGGVKIHDISDPANPEELAWWRQPADTSFWTAQHATSSFFVASSMGWYNSGKGALYTFPNREGEQQDPPALVTPVPETTETNTTSPAVTESATIHTSPPTEDDVDGLIATDGQRGFGVPAALCGLAVGMWNQWTDSE